MKSAKITKRILHAMRIAGTALILIALVLFLYAVINTNSFWSKTTDKGERAYKTKSWNDFYNDMQAYDVGSAFMRLDFDARYFNALSTASRKAVELKKQADNTKSDADIVNEIAAKFEEADGLVIGSPVYYGSANGTLMSALQRLFYSTHFDKSFKVGASVVSARRSGCTATFDELNKFFTLSNMPVATSQYWNNIYGWEPGEGNVDDEGRQVMRVLARNMVFLMEGIALNKEKNGLPKTEERVWTNFTR